MRRARNPSAGNVALIALLGVVAYTAWQVKAATDRLQLPAGVKFPVSDLGSLIGGLFTGGPPAGDPANAPGTFAGMQVLSSLYDSTARQVTLRIGIRHRGQGGTVNMRVGIGRRIWLGDWSWGIVDLGRSMSSQPSYGNDADWVHYTGTFPVPLAVPTVGGNWDVNVRIAALNGNLLFDDWIADAAELTAPAAGGGGGGGAD